MPVYKVIMDFDLIFFSFHISFVDCYLQSVSLWIKSIAQQDSTIATLRFEICFKLTYEI